VILPTRELSMQVFKEFDLLAQKNEYKCLSIYGGTNVADQINEVIQGIDVAVGTPGRILDLLNRNVL
jgi:superfamily II DNA/RNA helicase